MQELKGAKMNWKNRLRNYNFWISMFSAVLLILQALKLEFDIAYVNEIFTAVLGLLVVIGIISDPTRMTVKSNEIINREVTVKKETESTNEIEANSEIKENVLPIEKENEVDCVVNQIGVQTILEKITTSLDEKMKEIAQLNYETLNKINQIQNADNSLEKNASISKVVEEISKIETPAAAEMSNPFIDVIN